MTEKQLKEIFKGRPSGDDDISSYDHEQWKIIINTLFNKVEYLARPYNLLVEKGDVVSCKQFGRITLDDDKSIALFEVEVGDSIIIERNRKGLRDIAAKYIDQNIIHAALVFYFSPTQDSYRLTLIAKWSDIDHETGELTKGETQQKRFTYLFGPRESGTTPAKRFKELASKSDSLKFTLPDVIDAFSVEKLNTEFFKKYKDQYDRFNNYLKEHSNYRYNLFNIGRNEKDGEKEKNEVVIRDFSKKLLGRIVFLYFLQKKGWMGVPTPSDENILWENGKINFLPSLFRDCEFPSKFHSKYLSALFYDTLNNGNRAKCVFHIDGKSPFYDGKDLSVPFLNGGLFEDDFPRGKQIDFPVDYFTDLFDFFDQYNFTIDENSPEDHEVGIDPEMLGHIFENLLDDNRDKGTYYTPKEVVHYMSQQSIIQYLKSRLSSEIDEIDLFVKQNKLSGFVIENATEIDSLLKNVKICDPAIGSGAFPMGVLKVIFNARHSLHGVIDKDSYFDAAQVKKDIIHHSIYGVDLENGAVEIARLRFWLALVVDELEPHPLPNLDYKIMQGNSVLESFEGIELGVIVDEAKNTAKKRIIKVDLFGNASKEDLQKTHSYSDIADELKELVSAFFDIDNTSKKQDIRNRINRLVHLHILYNIDFRKTQYSGKLAALSGNLDKKQAKARSLIEEELQKLEYAADKLIQIENSQERPFFLWKLFFKEVFDGGKFDIIIGNPPYIKEFTNRDAFNGLRESSYFMGKMDIWYFFACFCIDLLRDDGGIQCFIAQNNWITSTGAEILRDKVLKETEIVSFIDFGNYKVFQSAGIQTMIYVLRKKQPRKIYPVQYSRLLIDNIDKEYLGYFLDVHKAGGGEYVYGEINLIPDKLIGNYISFNDPVIERILSKISDAGSLLFEKNEVAQGIVAPQDYLNKKNAEILGEDFTEGEGIFQLTESQLINLKLSESEMELIKPFYSTEQLGRFYGNSNNTEWIIYTNSDARNYIQRYPALKSHLERFAPVITSSFGPYGLHRSRDERFFKGEKIMSLRKCARPTFTYTDFNCYVSQTYFVIKTERINLKYLTAILNSKLVAFWLKYKGKLSGNLYQVDKEPLLEIPIAICDRYHILVVLVDYVLFVFRSQNEQIIKYIDNDLMVHAFEELIDHIVYEIYFADELKKNDLLILDFLTNIASIDNLDDTEKKETITKFYHWLNEQQNPIRNCLLKANIVSKDLLAIINSHIN